MLERSMTEIQQDERRACTITAEIIEDSKALPAVSSKDATQEEPPLPKP